MDGSANKSVSSISKLTTINVQCVGPWFISLWEGRPLEEDVICLKDTSHKDLTSNDDDYINYLRRLDPKEWKKQDHYAVLGLRDVRYKATEEEIKKAYRMKVLQHHPDKRKAKEEEIRPDDDYFTCITKAWEILGNPCKRRSYDSVDSEVDDSVPPNNEHTKKHFFDIFGNVFERNARWSQNKPVPKLGGPEESREAVEKFYAFWYNFKSWREFSYLDEEEKDQGSSREERRYIERQNKAARMRLKNGEMSRLRSLVDVAYSIDPRVEKFKKEDKEKKMALKQAKKEAARARIEEEERKRQAEAEEAQRIKAEREANEKAKQAAIKAEKDAQKKLMKAKRSALRKIVKSNDYFANESELVHHMASLEKICESFQAEKIEDLTKNIQSEGRVAFLEAISEVERRIEEKNQSQIEAAKRDTAPLTHSKTKGGCAPWSPEELTLLIKAVNIFPAGTNQRWSVVANFINTHKTANDILRTAKEVLSKAKDLQNSDYQENILKAAVSNIAYSCFEIDKSNADATFAVSERFDSPQEQQSDTTAPWTANEQQLLEQTLKTYPVGTPERWDKIADCIPTRDKKACIRRYKEIVEMVKAKRAAVASVLEQKKK